MQILSSSRKQGMFFLRVDNEDDLWHLNNLIKAGDRVKMLSKRSQEKQKDAARDKKTEKKVMMITLKIIKSEFTEFSSYLRLLGTIVDGPQDLGSHHTFNLETGSKLSLFKEWTREEEELLQRAVKESRKPNVLFLSIEDGNAVLVVQMNQGLKVIAEIDFTISGKFYKQDKRGKKDFFQEVLSKLQQCRTEKTPLIIIGPGFTKDEFLRYSVEKEPHIKENVFLKATGQAGLTGIYEALKSGMQELFVNKARVTLETQELDLFFTELSKDGAVTYGRKEVLDALGLGAVEKLLLTDTVFRKDWGKALIKKAHETGAQHWIISTAHEGGKRLDSIGGAAAVLRYKLL